MYVPSNHVNFVSIKFLYHASNWNRFKFSDSKSAISVLIFDLSILKYLINSFFSASLSLDSLSSFFFLSDASDLSKYSLTFSHSLGAQIFALFNLSFFNSLNIYS